MTGMTTVNCREGLLQIAVMTGYFESLYTAIYTDK